MNRTPSPMPQLMNAVDTQIEHGVSEVSMSSTRDDYAEEPRMPSLFAGAATNQPPRSTSIQRRHAVPDRLKYRPSEFLQRLASSPPQYRGNVEPAHESNIGAHCSDAMQSNSTRNESAADQIMRTLPYIRNEADYAEKSGPNLYYAHRLQREREPHQMSIANRPQTYDQRPLSSTDGYNNINRRNVEGAISLLESRLARYKPFQCNFTTCTDVRFPSVVCLLRHERETHGMHGHNSGPHLCTYTDCERSKPDNGFPQRYNLFDHMKRVHGYTGPTPGSGEVEDRQRRKKPEHFPSWSVDDLLPDTKHAPGVEINHVLDVRDTFILYIPVNHFELPPRAPDPYKTFGVLGYGAYGYVDKVESKYGSGQIHARKLSILPPRGQRRDAAVKALREEARIAASLRSHPHIINVVETFQWGNRFGIVMSPVAECDLAQFLEEVDHMAESAGRYDLIRAVPRMCGCLIRALDYVHSQGVRHKDIKPSNILLSNGEVILTDFGIARDLSDLETTGTTGEPGARSVMYCAPEANNETGRRGRSADVFSLGCVVLELVTVLCCDTGGLQFFKNSLHIEDAGETYSTYSTSASRVLQWITYLWPKISYQYGDLILLSLLMLHPDPTHRQATISLCIMFNNSLAAHPNYRCSSCSPPYSVAAGTHWAAYRSKVISALRGGLECTSRENFINICVADSLQDLGWNPVVQGELSQASTPDFDTDSDNGDKYDVELRDLRGINGTDWSLPEAAAWDYVQAHSLCKQGVFTVTDVFKHLEGLAQPSGAGYAYDVRDVSRAIEACKRGR